MTTEQSIAQAAVQKTIRLDEMLEEGELDWGFNLGWEFRGAKGGLDLVRGQPEAGKNAMRLYADFTGGGAYVGARKSLAQLEVQETRAIRLRMRSETAAFYAVRLADRLGLRLMGVWGGWPPKPPYEPHGTGQKVLDNVRAYKAIYETVKAFDPKIHVIGTSVEPNEEYFKAGYQNWLDSYDFHIYEHYGDVRRTMREYRELMKKYGAVKPIHSTELGLNSQGQTRLAVAREMVKKLAVFFAEGGATVSWFTIQYPDPQGKARGQAGDAHCDFDCRYDLYNPRLDAGARGPRLRAAPLGWRGRRRTGCSGPCGGGGLIAARRARGPLAPRRKWPSCSGAWRVELYARRTRGARPGERVHGDS
ncbi:MAG: hypothetical protein FJ291_15930 [Planctomycetes bacterium]|nr:hypothetical protein [Planctomycetota bacterium]